MSAKHLIGRLSDRTDILADRIKPRSKQAIIAVPGPGMLDEDAVVARYMKLFPDDRNAKQTIVIRLFLDAADVTEPDEQLWQGKLHRAWLEIARELQR